MSIRQIEHSLLVLLVAPREAVAKSRERNELQYSQIETRTHIGVMVLHAERSYWSSKRVAADARSRLLRISWVTVQYRGPRFISEDQDATDFIQGYCSLLQLVDGTPRSTQVRQVRATFIYTTTTTTVSCT